MPLYFFDVMDGLYEPDDIGVELQNPREASSEATRLAGELLVDDPLKWGSQEWSVQVRDETGFTLFRLTVSTRYSAVVNGKRLDPSAVVHLPTRDAH